MGNDFPHTKNTVKAQVLLRKVFYFLFLQKLAPQTLLPVIRNIHTTSCSRERSLTPTRDNSPPQCLSGREVVQLQKLHQNVQKALGVIKQTQTNPQMRYSSP